MYIILNIGAYPKLELLHFSLNVRALNTSAESELTPMMCPNRVGIERVMVG